MSPSICASYCATVEGAVYFGVEFSYEVGTKRAGQRKGASTYHDVWSYPVSALGLLSVPDSLVVGDVDIVGEKDEGPTLGRLNKSAHLFCLLTPEGRLGKLKCWLSRLNDDAGPPLGSRGRGGGVLMMLHVMVMASSTLHAGFPSGNRGGGSSGLSEDVC